MHNIAATQGTVAQVAQRLASPPLDPPKDNRRLCLALRNCGPKHFPSRASSAGSVASA